MGTASTAGVTKSKPDFAESLRALGERMKAQMGARLHESDSTFDVDRLMKDIKEQIIRDRRAITLAFMGIETSFGNMGLSYTERNINQEIKRRIEIATQQWIADNPNFFDDEVAKVCNNPKVQKAMRTRFSEILRHRLADYAVDAADRVAKTMAKDLETEVRGYLSLRSPEE